MYSVGSVWPSTSLKEVRPTLNYRSILQAVAAKDVLALATSDCSIIICRLDEGRRQKELVVPKRNEEDKIFKVFLDASGRHSFISLECGSIWYLNTKTMKYRYMINWPGYAMSAICFTCGEDTNKMKIIIGTGLGHVYETFLNLGGNEFFFNLLYKIEPSAVVSSIYLQTAGQKQIGENTFFVLLVSMSFRPCVYRFCGGPTLELLFAPFRSRNVVPYYELPLCFDELQYISFCKVGDASLSFALQGNRGVLHGQWKLDFANELPFDKAIEAKFLEFPRNQAPVSFSSTEEHFLLLYNGILLIINRQSGDVVEEIETDIFVLSSRNDVLSTLIYLHSEFTVYGVSYERNKLDAWIRHLEQAIFGDEDQFKRALACCYSLREVSFVNYASACYLAKNGRHVEAATSHFVLQDFSSFEEVALLLLDISQKGALSQYLNIKATTSQAKDETQKTMLYSWLTDLYVDLQYRYYDAHKYYTSKIMKSFLSRHGGSPLHAETTLQIFYAHSLDEEALLFAKAKNAYERIVAHYLREKSWDAAIRLLDHYYYPHQDSEPETVAELFYDASPLLLEKAPLAVVQALLRKQGLHVEKLLPGLFRMCGTNDGRSLNTAHGAKLLLEACTDDNPSKGTLQKYILELHAKYYWDDNVLLSCMHTSRTDLFDLQYALRVCARKKSIRTSAWIYAKLGLYEDSVALAITSQISLAKKFADLPDIPSETRRLMWLTIAKHIIEDRSLSIGEAVKILVECPLLTIEDILPFFPDFAVIDSFKSEICTLLQEANSSIDNLKVETCEFSENNLSIRNEIVSLDVSSIMIESRIRCALSGNAVLSGPFYYFSSGYAVTLTALLEQITPHLTTVTQNRVRAIARSLKIPHQGQFDVESQLHELDSVFASDCPLTGSLMIGTVNSVLSSQSADALWCL